VSEVIINGWTWHNPVGFKPGGELLYIDRLSLRLSLASLLPAIRKTGELSYLIEYSRKHHREDRKCVS